MRFSVAMATTGDSQDFEGKEVKGLSSAQRRNQNLLFAETAALKIDVQQEASLRGGGGALVVSDPAWKLLRKPSPRKLPPAESSRFPSVCASACEVVGLFSDIPGQSVDSSRLAFFSFTSEASPQVVAYFSVAMATGHGNPTVAERKKK